jgi:hypothetical protein
MSEPKRVQVVGYMFDALPGHVMASGEGEGGNLRTAVTRAVADMLKAPAVYGKRIRSFKISVTVELPRMSKARE